VNDAKKDHISKDLANHWYYSTACLHEKHEACRQTCKFCHDPCHCECHPDITETMISRRKVTQVE